MEVGFSHILKGMRPAPPVSALHAAVEKGDLEEVEMLLDSALECDLMLRNASGRIPLHEAIQLGKGKRGGAELCEAMVGLFLPKCQDSHWLLQDGMGFNALHHACERKLLPVVRIVLRHTPREALTATDNSDRTPAMTAVDTTANIFSNTAMGLAVVKALPWEALIAQGPLYGENALLNAVLRCGDDVLSYILDNSPPDCDFTFEPVRSENDGLTILHCYVASPNKSARGLSLLLSRVPPSMVAVTSRGYTPLHYVKTPEVARMLLERMTPEECGIQNTHGDTALHCAESGELAVLIAEHMHSDDLGLLNDAGNTPLLKLLMDWLIIDAATAEVLVGRTSDEALAIANEEGATVLHFAAFLKELHLVRLLLDRLPDSALLEVDIFGNTLLHCCLTKSFHDEETDAEPTPELLELLMGLLPKSYRTKENDNGESPAELAEDLDEEIGDQLFSKYFVSTAKGATS